MEHRALINDTTVSKVQELLSQHAFLEAFSEEVGVTAEKIDIATTEETTQVTMPWMFRTDKPGIPSLAQKFLPKEVELLWFQEWQQSAPSGSLRVELRGHPSATCTGESSLAQQDDNVDYVVTTETKSSVPWPLGGKLESTINKDLVGWILQVQVRVLNRTIGA